MSGNWKPIESAPKDRTLVDLYSVTYETRHICAFYEHGKWWEYWINDQGKPGYVEIKNPSHWMPCPKPPEDND